jgi:hypothetical protein
MIIYVNIDKTTGEITVNNDSFPDSDVVQLNPNSLENTETSTKFEIAFNVTSFQSLDNTTGSLNGNTN